MTVCGKDSKLNWFMVTFISETKNTRKFNLGTLKMGMYGEKLTLVVQCENLVKRFSFLGNCPKVCRLFSYFFDDFDTFKDVSLL